MGIVSIKPQVMKTTGSLVADEQGRLFINCREGDPERRKRFTIAHELGHLLIARSQGEDVVEYHRGKGHVCEEERAANQIAAELLMPEDVIRRKLRRHMKSGWYPSWRFLVSLSDFFDVSLSAIAFRLLEIRCAYTVLLRIAASSETGHDDLLFQDRRSRQGGIAYKNPPRDEAMRILKEADKSRFHEIPVITRAGYGQLKCESRLRQFQTPRGTLHQYWVIGWFFCNA
jgi:hypothetical protein